MAFLLAGVFALTATGSYYWWGGSSEPVAVVATTSVTSESVPVATSAKIQRTWPNEAPTLLDELKVIQAARRARNAPGTC